MAYLLSHKTALEWFRLAQGVTITTTRFDMPMLALESDATRMRRHVSELAGVSQPYHVVVPFRDRRVRSKLVVAHYTTSQKGVFLGLRVARGLFCSPPETLFSQVAARMSEEQLVFLGHELCGVYGIDAHGVYKRPAACTLQMLADHLASVRGVRGKRMALRACELIHEGSGSPMETALAMMLCLPPEQGGFGLPWPTFNEAQPVNGRARRLWVSDFIAPDLLWKDAKLCIEYDSDTHHSGSERIARDASRRDVLEELGLRVVTVTSEHLRDLRGVERVARVVAGALGIDDPAEDPVTRRLRSGLLWRLRGYAADTDRLLGLRA